MSFLLKGLFPERKVTDASALTMSALLNGPSSKTGLSINEMSALRVTAVLACCRVICEDIGKIPLKVLLETKETKESATHHPLYNVLYRRPNEWQTSMEWRMTMMLHALLCLGGYSFINRSTDGEVLELIPLIPNRVRVKQDAQWNVTYDVSDAKGKIVTLQRDQVHVLRGLSWDGVNSMSLVSAGREAIGLSMAAEETQARLHGQGARPGGVLTTSAQLTDQQILSIKSQFADSYAGIQNAFKTLLLDNGLEFKTWAMSGVDAQHIETRRHQVEEVARLFRVFPAMIGYADKTSTYASAEAFFIAHVVHTLMPWAVNWEQSMERDLLTPKELRKGYHVKLFLQGLLRGDAKTRAAFYASGITAGWMTRNEARRAEDLNPLPGLDEPLMPANMQSGSEAPTADPEPTLDG